MADIDKSSLSERDVCTKFITPAIEGAGWDKMNQMREEVSFTKGRVIVRGCTVRRSAPQIRMKTERGYAGINRNPKVDVIRLAA